MFKKAILSLSAALCLGSTVFGQQVLPCATDEHHKDQVRMFPQITATEAQLERDVEAYIKAAMFGQNSAVAAKGTNRDWDTITNYFALTGHDTQQLHIPIVVHIVHDYGVEYISDNRVYEMIKRLNVYYNKQNADTAAVIAPFKQYIGNARITFHLANKDPQGQPTTGITRHYSFTTAGGDEYAKAGQWPANRYLNIWVENRIGRGTTGGIVAAYSRFPSDGYSNPFGDGIISNYQFIGGNDNTMEHEIGHYFNLLHVWNSSLQSPCVAVGDDAVDDTPPTKGHFSGTCAGCPLYDTVGAIGYRKTYNYASPTQIDSIRIDSTSIPHDTTFFYRTITATVDFPDTVNVQNIMDYSSCTNMFTIGQVMRMRASLQSPATTRPNLATKLNLLVTGVYSPTDTSTIMPTPDLAPIADFSVNRNFICANGPTVTLTNRTWRDTATAAWELTNGNPSTSTSTGSILATFSEPGWAKIKLTANSNAGTNTLERNNLLYVADQNAVPAENYYQEFNPGSDMDQFPIFNYYNTPYKWEVINNAGYYDNTSIKFNNYDPRPSATILNMTQTPKGNFADFYTRAYDLSGAAFSSKATLTFYSAGAFRTVNPRYMNDSLVVHYSIDCGATWVRLNKLDGGALANRGSIATEFTPQWMGDWQLKGMALPATLNVRTSPRIFFRFRFYSGTDNAGISGYEWGTGNNFYLDRISVTGNALGIDGVELEKTGMTVAPNPTHGSATVSVKGGDNSTATINVTDVTGKLVYRTELRLSQNVNNIEIPADRIAVKGMYLVNVVSNGNAQTRKLIVY